MSLTVNGNGDTAYTTGDTITTSANTGTNIFGNDNTADLATGQVVGVYGGGNTVSAQSGNHVYVVGTDTNFDNITVSNDNTGTTAFDGEAGGIFLDNNVQVSLSGSNDTLGLGGTGDSLGVFGDSNTIDAGAGNWIVVGSPWSAVDTLNVTGDQGSGTTANGQPVGIAVNPDAGANVSGGDDAVYLQTGSSYVGLLGGSGYTVVTYTGGTVATWADTSFNMYGIDTNIYSGGGDNFGAFGGGNVITAQEGDSVTIDETAGNIDSVYVTNDQAGIFINSGGSANVTWGGDTIVLNGEGSYAGLIGYAGYTVWASSGGSMATTADTGFTVNGSNTSIDDTAGGDYFGVSGGGNNIQAQSGDHIFLSGTDGNFDAVTAAGDNASTTSADGEQGGIWLYSNTQLQLIGSYNLTNLGSGDNLDASGGGNAINAQANDFVYISGTGGNLDSVSASGLQDNGTSADGDTSGIYLAAGAEANVSGGNDAIFPDSGSYVGLLGGTGYSVSGAGFSLDTSPDTGFDVFRQRRQISASARRQSCRSKQRLRACSTPRPGAIIVEQALSSNDLTVEPGDDAGVYGGGGNTVTMVANAQVDLGNTYGDADTVDASNETSGIYLSADTQADVNGSEDRVYLLGSDATVSENGSYNFIEDVDPDATADIVIDESNSFIDLPSSDTVTINGSNDYITGDNDNIQTNGNSDPVVGDYDITTGSGSDDITDGTGDTDYGSEYQNNNFSDGDYVGNDYGDFSFGYDSDLGLVATSGNSITNVVAQNDAANGYQLQAASANAALASAMDAQAGDFATSPSTLNKQPAHAFWTQSTITWSFASGATSGASPISSAIGALEQPIIESAIQAWASASGLTLQQVSGNADLNIGWADFETPTSNVAGFTSASSLGNMLLPGSVVRLEDPGETALVADLSGEITYAGTDVTLYQVALHEIGHALGLADDSDPDSVMYASLGPTNMTLDNTDIAAIQSLYGPEGTATAFFPATLSAAAAAASLATGSAPVLAAGLVH